MGVEQGKGQELHRKYKDGDERKDNKRGKIIIEKEKQT